MGEGTGVTGADAERFLLGGVVLHCEGRIDFEAWFGSLAHRIDADVASVAAILRAPHGLSVVVPVRDGDSRRRAVLEDLVAQTAEAGTFEIVVAPFGATRSPGGPDGPSGSVPTTVLPARGTRGDAVNAGLAAAAKSHVVVVEPGDRLTPDFVGGLLRACAGNTLVFARDPAEDAAPCPDGHFSGVDVLPPEHAAFLAPRLGDLSGTAMPRIIARFVRFRDELGPEADRVFWCEVVATFHPAFRRAAAGNRARSSEEPSETGRDAVTRALAACGALAEIGRTNPHPILIEAAETLCLTVRAAVLERPERGFAAFREARALSLPARDVDACFHGVPLSGAAGAREPSISVIVPVFNTEGELDRCLDSILTQTLTDIEVLCVDDCSSDGSLDRLKWHADRDPRIRILSHGANRGPGGARNAALAASRGRYVSFIDSDDRVAPVFLERLWQGTRDGHFDIVVCGGAVVDVTGRVINRIDIEARSLDPVDPAANRLAMLNPNLWNKLWRRSLFFEPTPMLFPETIYFQDAATVPRLARRVSAINWIGEVLYDYIARAKSITRSYGPKSIMSYMAIFDCVKDDLIASNEYELYVADFEKWVDANLNYHRRTVAGLDLPPETRAVYLRHVEIVRRGYLASDDRLRHEMRGEADALLSKHHGL